MGENCILQVKELRTSFFTAQGEIRAVDGVSFELGQGKILGLVGESGSGKSVTACSIMRILARGGRITGGEVLYRGENVTQYTEEQMRRFRGARCAMIFQDPMSSLDPVYTIGAQIEEALRLHGGRERRRNRARAVELLELVGVDEPERRVRQYPHELSGGMRQRAMIAIALACAPELLIADEPTTALDVTIQAQILALIRQLQRKLGMSVILVTHDLGVVAQLCDEVVVMYAGRVCERGAADEVFRSPRHEYTKGLLRSIPRAEEKGRRLVPIAGAPAGPLELPQGCAFCARCARAQPICSQHLPQELAVSARHRAACWLNAPHGALEMGGAEHG